MSQTEILSRMNKPAEAAGEPPAGAGVVLSFDVEEHHRIEAASALAIDPATKARHAERVGPVTRWLLDRLDEREIKATFFVVGELARDQPELVRAIQAGGHEVASHGWDHRRVLAMTPEEFRADVRRSVDILQQITGTPVVGYRAPTFSIVRRTAWALDVLAELGILYDSSIYPVRHDRYGVPDAPRVPFLAEGPRGGRIIELPPATLRLGRVTLPVGGGGYFRLFPPSLMEWGVRQALAVEDGQTAAATLYFHPWEFDPEQPRLPLRGSNRFRTYVGLRRSRGRLVRLLRRHRFERAVDAAGRLDRRRHALPGFAFRNIDAVPGPVDS